MMIVISANMILIIKLKDKAIISKKKISKKKFVRHVLMNWENMISIQNIKEIVLIAIMTCEKR